jgi:hypothetical protein
MCWCRTGTWSPILTTIRDEVRTRSGRRRRPTAPVVDSSSVKASPVAGPPGFDGAKKVHGVKRHILVDSGAVLVAAVITTANVQDRGAFPRLMRNVLCVAPTIRHLWLDNGYTGQTVTHAATNAAVTVDVISGPKPKTGFGVQPRRCGSRTHQRLDQPLPTSRPPLRSHPRCSRMIPRPQPNRPATPQTRPQPVVRHALVTAVTWRAHRHRRFDVADHDQPVQRTLGDITAVDQPV